MRYLYMYYDEVYVEMLLTKTTALKQQILLNIYGKEFSKNELVSLRNIEVILLPKDNSEFISMRHLQTNIFARYGLVSTVKKPLKDYYYG